MKYYDVYPQVAANLGDRTLGNIFVRPLQIEKLHWVFVGWLGDSLLKSLELR